MASTAPPPDRDGRTLTVLRVRGSAPYARILEWQRRLGRARSAGELPQDVLLLVEHPPVVTLGRGAEAEHLLATPERLVELGVERVEVERGGDVTYHGPGQLVGYPILDLRRLRRDLHWYLRELEEVLIRALARRSLEAFRIEGHTGVWVGEGGEGLDARSAAPLVAAGRARKIASIGVHVRRWVTWHGFALNVTREPLEAFGLIVPCGIAGVRMTCVAAEPSPCPPWTVREAGARVAEELARRFGLVAGGALPPALAPPDGTEVEELVAASMADRTGGNEEGAAAAESAAEPDGSELVESVL